MAPETSVKAPESAPKAASRWEDFVDIFFSPGELFQRRANDKWWIPIMVLTLGSLALFIAFSPVSRAMQETAMLNNPDVRPEAVEAMRNMGSLFLVFGALAVVFFAFVFTLVTAFVGWLTAKITSIELPFRRALTITTYVGFLGLVQQAAIGIVMSLKLRSGAELDAIKDSSFGVLRFLDSSSMSSGVIAVLSRVDIFALWIFAWYAIAFVAASKAPRGAALITAAVLWLFGALPYLFQAIGTR
jgi:hypothetical protein